MNKLSATDKPDNLNDQPVSRYARAREIAVTVIHELFIALLAGFVGLGVYQFMLMLGVIPAT